MSENEQFFDDVIAPELKRLATMARDRGMNFVATVEYERNCVGRTDFCDLDDAGPQFRVACYGARANGNLDVLINACIKDDKKHVPVGGKTNSFYMRMLTRDHP